MKYRRFAAIGTALLSLALLMFLSVSQEQKNHRNNSELLSTIKSSEGPRGEESRDSFEEANALPESVQVILGLHQEPLLERLKKASSFQGNLNHHEFSALARTLSEPINHRELKANLALKNEILRVLGRQLNQRASLWKLVADLFTDKENSEGLRDYLLQHLISWYEEQSDKEIDTRILRRVESVIWSALNEFDSGIAGTALLSLSHLSQRHRIFDRSRIQQAAVMIADRKDTCELSRIAALQVCGEMHIQRGLQLARRFAQESISYPVRISAIAAIGALGGRDDLELLSRLSSNRDPRLSTAVQLAQGRLTAHVIP